MSLEAPAYSQPPRPGPQVGRERDPVGPRRAGEGSASCSLPFFSLSLGVSYFLPWQCRDPGCWPGIAHAFITCLHPAQKPLKDRNRAFLSPHLECPVQNPPPYSLSSAHLLSLSTTQPLKERIPGTHHPESDSVGIWTGDQNLCFVRCSQGNLTGQDSETCAILLTDLISVKTLEPRVGLEPSSITGGTQLKNGG